MFSELVLVGRGLAQFNNVFSCDAGRAWLEENTGDGIKVIPFTAADLEAWCRENSL